jgi:hypothetical protein
MAQHSNHRSTVAIPLHASAPWIDRVEANVRSLREVATVLISDVSGRDDSLAVLRARLGEHPDVQWSTSSNVEPGWVAHCNALRTQANSEFFMWLAHDDLVEPRWVAEGERALDANRDATIAVGHLVSERVGKKRKSVAPVADYEASDAETRVAASLHRLFVGRQDGLGHAYRGLMRREMAPELPFVDAGGTKADMYWALTLLWRGPFVTIDASYTKNWHERSASAGWGPITKSPVFRAGLNDALRELPIDVRDHLLAAAWTNEALHLRERIDDLEQAGSGSKRGVLARARERLHR